MARPTQATRLILAGAFLVVACTDSPEPTAVGEGDDSIAPPASVQPTGLDPKALAGEIPGFGGFYVDADGTPTVFLTDPGQRGIAERAMSNALERRGFSAAQLRVREAGFTYARLGRWFERTSPEVLAERGVVFVDLDEAGNRLLVGVENEAGAARVRSVVARIGVPADAVTIREVEPVRYAATLRDRVRPVQGGLQINFGNFLCTLGFNASHGGGDSFITNSHCTDKQGGTEGTEYFQPLASVANSAIGTEVDDPEYFRRGECPRGRKCRYSDSSRALYDGGVDFGLGSIARTASRGALSGSLEIVGTFTITGEQADPIVGEELNKVGRTTGWTFGTVTNTCVDTNVARSNITQLCQTFVNAGVGSGDSGSPVFHWPGSGSDITLYGILWGGSGNDLYVFSPMSGIERELGSLGTS